MNIRDAIKLLVTLLVFAMMTFIALELTLRVYYFGPAGLSPARVNSFRNLFESGLVQPAENLQVWYQLKPDLNELFRGATLVTNSQGLADKEYSLAKPDATYRIAVVGSSWAMGSGVQGKDTFHAVLERQFNERSAKQKYEFINFGVENYGLGEMMGTIRHKVLAYQPDMILFIITGYTPAIRWVAHEEPFVPLPVAETHWRSYALLKLRAMLGQSEEGSADVAALRETVRMNEWGLYFKQIRRALDELQDVAVAGNIDIGAAWIRLGAVEGQKVAELFQSNAAQRGIAATVIDMETFLQPGEPIRRLLVNRVEKHPSPYGHGLIADRLYETVFGSTLPVAAP